MTPPFPEDFLDSNQFLESEEALPRRPRRRATATHGAARWAGEGDLAPWTRALPPRRHDTVLRSFHPIVEQDDVPDGSAVRALYRRVLNLSEECRNRHQIAVGEPGSGKTSRLIMPTILSDLRDRDRTLVVFDPKTETAEVLESLVRDLRGPDALRVLNFGDPDRSLRWNPARPGMSSAQVHDLAHDIAAATENPSRHSDPFWFNNSIKVYTAVLHGLLGDSKESPSLPRVQSILELPRDEFFTWCRERESVDEIRSFVRFLDSGSHNAETILSDAQMRVQCFMDEALSEVMGEEGFSIDELVERPLVLVVEMAESKVSKLRPIWNLFLTRLMDRMIEMADSRPSSRLPRPVSLVIDEFASAIGRIPEFETRLNTLRSRRVAVTAALQSLGQLRHVYGDGADPILSAFSTKFFFGGLSQADAAYASGISGMMTVEDAVVQQEVDPHAEGGWRTTGRQLVSVGRPVLLPEDVARPPAHFMLGSATTVFLPGQPVFQAWMTPHYVLDEYRPALEASRDGSSGERIAARAREGRKARMKSAPRTLGRRKAAPKKTRRKSPPRAVPPDLAKVIPDPEPPTDPTRLVPLPPEFLRRVRERPTRDRASRRFLREFTSRLVSNEAGEWFLQVDDERAFLEWAEIIRAVMEGDE